MKTFLIVAATTDLLTSLGKVVGLLQTFSMVITFGAFIVAAVSVISGRLEFVKYALIGGAISGLSWMLIVALFKLGGVEGAPEPQPF